MKFLGRNEPYSDSSTAALLKLELLVALPDRSIQYRLFEDIKTIIDSGILTTPIPLTMTNIHGDLNLENILVTRAGDKLLGWFIDFARARMGHSVFDFVKLETEIKTHLLENT